MTAQEIFDTVARFLLKQKAPSVNQFNECRYRGDGGLKCAAGCLLTDDEYSPRMEDRAVRDLIVIGLWPARLREHAGLIGELQSVHDSLAPDKWARMLADVAEEHGLSPAVLDEVTP